MSESDNSEANLKTALSLEVNELTYRKLKLLADRLKITVPELAERVLVNLDEED